MAKKANKKKVVAKPAKKAQVKPAKKVVAKKVAPAPKAKVASKAKATPKAKVAPKAAPKVVAKAPVKEESKKEVKKEEAPVVKSKPGDRLYARDYRAIANKVFKPMSGSFAVVYFVYAIIVGAIVSALGSIAMIDFLKEQPKDMSFYIGVGSTIAASLVSLFALLTNGPFIFGEINLAKEAHHNNTKPTVGGLFYGFKKRYGQSLAVDIIKTIFTVLWSLLLIIPGIIKSFSYALSEYIALDNPGKDTLECITESRQLMKGHKWQLFCMRLSYIGWFLLVIITLGIMSFWVLPRFRQANYEFYLHIAGKDKK